MKRVVLALLAVLLAPSLAWGDDSRHYEFRLAANGEATYHAAAGAHPLGLSLHRLVQ